MRIWSGLLGLGLAACSSADAEITLKFATPEARARTRAVAFTAFEPILAQPDAIDQVPRFISCDEVSVFPPSQTVDPDTISTFPNLAGVIAERTTQSFPLEDDWLVDLRADTYNPELNPWGAVMVYVEARGDARAPASRGGGQVSTTLLSGCFCLRTTEESHPDIGLDQRVKEACRPLEGDAAVTEQDVFLGPVAPDAFRLVACDGADRLTAPRDEVVSPGPGACLETTQCDALTVPGPCFDCEQPCSELNDQSNVPVQFEVFREGRPSPEETHVVLTDDGARAEASFVAGDCAEDVRVEARVVGRSDENISFTVECVETIPGFDCPVEIQLDPQPQVRAIARVVGDPAACRNGNPTACDRLAVVSVLSTEATDRTFLTIYEAESGRTLTSTVIRNEAGHAVTSYFYEERAPGRPAAAPVVVLATSRGLRRELRLRVFRWDYQTQRLLPHDGERGILDAPCRTWMCGSLQPCAGAGSCGDREVCWEGMCQTEGETNPMRCVAEGPVYCNCEQNIEFQTRVTLHARDLDGDGFADLAVGNSGQLNVHFFYSGQRPSGALYGDDCTCGRFGVAPNVFTLATLGGDAPDRREVDMAIGNNGGLYLKYADRISTGIPVQLHCGQSNPVGDNVAVRDVQSAPLLCRIDDPNCTAYDDVVSLSARTIAGGSVNDPGALRITSGSPANLAPGNPVPPGIRREIVPRTFDGRPSRPEDPQRVRLADYNGDGHLDLAVLYNGSQEIHVWLGASTGAFGEVSEGIVLDECASSFQPNCPPLSDLVAFDGDGDGRDALAVVCSPSGGARLRVYTPRRGP